MMLARLRPLALACAALASAARADAPLYDLFTRSPLVFTIGWEVAVPTFALRSNFVDATSFAGLGTGLHVELGDSQYTLGAELSWNRFRQDTALGDRLDLDVVALRGVLHRYVAVREVQLYAGVGVGGLYREAILNGGPTQVGVGLCGGPEAGVLWPFGRGVAFHLAARYVFTTASFDVNGNPAWNVRLPSWFALQAGVAFF